MRGNQPRGRPLGSPNRGLSPRVRGNQNRKALARGERGLSPRVRGNQARSAGVHRAAGGAGSIPARAGEPQGLADMSASWYQGNRGLSPRVRGNPPTRRIEGKWPGSIPARAGEPLTLEKMHQVARVYPRACGGTRAPGRPATVGHAGSIPARAGEPLSGAAIARVYPRACGGTSWIYPLAEQSRRTNRSIPARAGEPLDSSQVRRNESGSIPARAGEPTLRSLRDRGNLPGRPVYPRACGGTQRHVAASSQGGGLSPRVRGNRDD